jgi:hypothetical protein
LLFSLCGVVLTYLTADCTAFIRSVHRRRPRTRPLLLRTMLVLVALAFQMTLAGAVQEQSKTRAVVGDSGASVEIAMCDIYCFHHGRKYKSRYQVWEAATRGLGPMKRYAKHFVARRNSCICHQSPP